jgi:histidinol-phosphatase
MITPSARDLQDRYRAAVELAQIAGARTLRVFQQSDLGLESKRDGTPVTKADRDAEAFLREAIAAKFPQDGILGEEFGESKGTSGVRWVLDPVDGTKAFVCGVPLYGTLIGVEWEGVPQIGVIELPALGERVHAATGSGTQWERTGQEGRTARVSLIGELSEAVLCTTDRGLFERVGGMGSLRGLESRVRLVRGWNDCYAYALLATGRVDVVVDPVMEVWDVAPLVPIVKEAGGLITNWQGEPEPHASPCLATNGILHAAARGAMHARPE